MKKLFTLTMLALLTAVGANAQTGLRKSWDFREGFSQKTINALNADMDEFGAATGKGHWRNWEKSESAADQQHFWSVSNFIDSETGYAVTWSGSQKKVIPELEGLTLSGGGLGEKHFVITYAGAQKDNASSPNGKFPYGQSYIWINGGSKTIKFEAEVGQEIRIGVESHSDSQDRGISLSASGGSLELVSGNPTPTFFNECVWNLKGTDGETATLSIKTTNGCHIYYIIVGDGKNPEKKSTIAYVTEGDATAEPAYQKLVANEELSVTALQGSTLSADALAAYTVTVVSPTLPVENAAVEVLKTVMPFTPMLNLNADLYGAWGYGEKIMIPDGGAVIGNTKSPLLADCNLIDMEDVFLLVLNEGDYTGLKLGDYFAGDDIVGFSEDDETEVAIHVHNIYHNAYVYIPQESVSYLPKLLANAIDLLIGSKTEVDKVTEPKITLEYKNLNTNISMAMASAAFPKPHIYYTLDGTDPIVGGNEYTEVLNVKEPCTVKAIAIAEGYYASNIASAEVAIYTQPDMPTISSVYNEGATEVTLASATDGVDIWYNYTEVNDTTKSMKYTAPISIKAPTTLTAFAVSGGTVFSELATERIVVKDAVVRLDVASHFSVPGDWLKADSSAVLANNGNMFRASRDDTFSMYSTEDSGQFDPVTGDPIKAEIAYEESDEPGDNPQWKVMTKGQAVLWQNNTPGTSPIGDDSGVNPYTAADIDPIFVATKNNICLYNIHSGEKPNAVIQSKNKYQGPFDVVMIDNMASGGLMIMVSTDGDTWNQIGETFAKTGKSRIYQKHTASYEGAEEVYVRVAQPEDVAGGPKVYDVYVAVMGENSQALKAEYDAEYNEVTTGIQNANKQGQKAVQAVYSLNGVRQQSLKRGLNIVVLGDGSVKKIVVK